MLRSSYLHLVPIAVAAGAVWPFSASTQSRAASHAAPPSSSWSSAPSAAVETLYVNLPGHAKSAVPGLNAHFQPGLGTNHFDRPFASANGHWVLTAHTDLPPNQDEVLLLDGAVLAREGTSAPWTASDFYGAMPTHLAVNDNGECALAINVDPASDADDYLVRIAPGGAVTVIARELDPIPYLPGVSYDDLFEGSVIAGDGSVGFVALGIDGPGITGVNNAVAEHAGALLYQTGVSVPAQQAGGAIELLEHFTTDGLSLSASGQHHLVFGDLTGAVTGDQVVIVDGNVVLQEGQVIPGSGFAYPIDQGGIVAATMDAGGHWFARGNNDVTDDDWVVRDGAVIAAVGQSVSGGSELWSDARYSDGFFAHAGNSAGDWVIGGLTDEVDLQHDAVLVWNDSVVLAREGDAIDVDGNGLFDDDAYFDTFGTDDVALTDAGTVYFTATMRNASATRIGQGFFRITLIPAPVVYCTAKVNALACLPSIGFIGTPSATVPYGFIVTSSDVRNNKPGLLFYGANGRNSSPFQGGTLCVKAPVRRTPVVNAGGSATPANDCSGHYVIDMNAYAAGHFGGSPLPALTIPGSVIDCQWWGRDPGFAAPDNTTLTDALEYVVAP